MSVRVEHGDCRDVIRSIPDASVHACVTDPPYDLKFMGRKWDTGEAVHDPDFWAEVLRVLKPGAHLLAFSGTRTYHRMACAIEDAGFEIRDMVGWLYGSGFPKSHDVSKAIDKAAGAEREAIGANPNARDSRSTIYGNGEGFGVGAITAPATAAAREWEGWGTALKPAQEPICFARKPLTGTVAANVLQHGTGALNIAATRIPGAKPDTTRGASGDGWGMESQGRILDDGNGRWPANVVHDGSDEVLAAFPDADGAVSNGRKGQNGVGNWGHGAKPQMPGYADNGSAARFFYTAKADAADRLGSKHPTVKPVSLMRWLVRLVTPPGGTVLDPFAGTGTTGMACMAEGFDCILIERESDYVADIKRRIAHVSGQDAPLFAGEVA